MIRLEPPPLLWKIFGWLCLAQGAVFVVWIVVMMLRQGLGYDDGSPDFHGAGKNAVFSTVVGGLFLKLARHREKAGRENPQR
jgi:hypothetical protein